jgi:hypothetical protein
MAAVTITVVGSNDFWERLTRIELTPLGRTRAGPQRMFAGCLQRPGASFHAAHRTIEETPASPTFRKSRRPDSNP